MVPQDSVCGLVVGLSVSVYFRAARSAWWRRARWCIIVRLCSVETRGKEWRRLVWIEMCGTGSGRKVWGLPEGACRKANGILPWVARHAIPHERAPHLHTYRVLQQHSCAREAFQHWLAPVHPAATSRPSPKSAALLLWEYVLAHARKLVRGGQPVSRDVPIHGTALCVTRVDASKDIPKRNDRVMGTTLAASQLPATRVEETPQTQTEPRRNAAGDESVDAIWNRILY